MELLRRHPEVRVSIMSLILLAGIVTKSAIVPLAVPAEPAQPETGGARAAQQFRAAGQPVEPISETTVLAEAEEFRIVRPGWHAEIFGSNYYAATFADTFLSRKAYLSAPEQSDRATATLDVRVPRPGRYLALVRYEAAYRFETQFRLQIAQHGQTRLDRLYGARQNQKIWAFHHGVTNEVARPGAGENIVWEGHEASVDLDAGRATLTLVADRQPALSARRNVDLVMLTSDIAQVASRIQKENYLPWMAS
jgi:hypothetical protein